MRLPSAAAQLFRRARAWADETLANEAVAERPRLAPDVELIGEYEGSGLKHPPYIAKRGDGQVVQVQRLLFLIASAADGERSTQEIASVVTECVGRRVSADDVVYLIDTKLRPLGLVIGRDGSLVAAERVDPLLALRLRAAVVPARFVRAVSWVLQPLFVPIIVGAALAWLVTFDVWLVGHGLGQGLHQVIGRPLLVLGMLGLVLVATAWHELGHATACRYGGATPGPVGVGLYLVWPAFYTDVTDAYRLDRAGRLRTDLGGVYFNVLFMLATAAAYFATGFEPLLVLVALQHLQTIQQFLPFVRLDGYYVITDLVGVPDILSRVRPILRSLVPGRRSDPRVTELKPWVRFTVTAYVLVLVAVLSAAFALMVVHAPRYYATAAEVFRTQLAHATAAVHASHWPAAAVSGLRILMVLLPAIGMAMVVLRTLRVTGRAARRRIARRRAERTPGHRARTVVAFAAGCAVALAVVNWNRIETLLGTPSRAAVEQCESHDHSARCRRLRRAEALDRRRVEQMVERMRDGRRSVRDGVFAGAATAYSEQTDTSTTVP